MIIFIVIGIFAVIIVIIIIAFFIIRKRRNELLDSATDSSFEFNHETIPFSMEIETTSTIPLFTDTVEDQTDPFAIDFTEGDFSNDEYYLDN